MAAPVSISNRRLGEVGVYNILKMASEGLTHELTLALHKAVTEQQIVRCPDVRVKTNGDFTAD